MRPVHESTELRIDLVNEESIAHRLAELLSAREAWPASDQVLTLAEAAALARCSTRTLRRALRSGGLRACQPSGRGGRILIAIGALDEWLFGAMPPSASPVHRPRRAPESHLRPISVSELRAEDKR
jgi:excisionase family DNA binding protein